MRVMDRGELIKNCCENQLGSKWECPPRREEYHYISSSSANIAQLRFFHAFCRHAATLATSHMVQKKGLASFGFVFLQFLRQFNGRPRYSPQSPQLDNGSPCVPWKRMTGISVHIVGVGVCVTIERLFPKMEMTSKYIKIKFEHRACDCRLLTVLGIWSPPSRWHMVALCQAAYRGGSPHL